MPPSKGKKKQQPAASPQPSPRTPSSRGPENRCGGGDEGSVDLPSIAAAAAARFPVLVPRSGEGCFAGAVAEVASRGTSSGGCLGRLWLSEVAMVGAGMRPGCLVSVSSCPNPFCACGPVHSTFDYLFLQIVFENTYNAATIRSYSKNQFEESWCWTLLLKFVFVF
jgi:hypothetical protein